MQKYTATFSLKVSTRAITPLVGIYEKIRAQRVSFENALTAVKLPSGVTKLILKESPIYTGLLFARLSIIVELSYVVDGSDPHCVDGPHPDDQWRNAKRKATSAMYKIMSAFNTQLPTLYKKRCKIRMHRPSEIKPFA